MMTKAFDAQDLLNRAKAKLLPIAGLLAGDLIDWTAESLEMNDKPLVKVLGGVVRAVKAPVLAELDKAVANIQNAQPELPVA